MSTDSGLNQKEKNQIGPAYLTSFIATIQYMTNHFMASPPPEEDLLAQAKVLDTFLKKITDMPKNARATAVGRHVRHFRVAPTYRKTHFKLEIGISATANQETHQLWEAMRALIVLCFEGEEKIGMAPKDNITRKLENQLEIMGLNRRDRPAEE